MLEPKYRRPVKEAGTWPGLFEVRYSKGGAVQRLEYRCPAPLCFYCIHISGKLMDKADDLIGNHPCPWYGGGTTTFSWSIMGSEYIEPIWEKLDLEVSIIKGATEGDAGAAKFRARGLAEALAVLMVPFFKTGDEIVREALVRFDHRGTDYCTPGIGRLKWKRPDLTYDPSNPSWLPEHDPTIKPLAKPVSSSVAHSLPPDVVAKIKASVGFPPKMLAAAYETTEAVIKHIQEN